MDTKLVTLTTTMNGTEAQFIVNQLKDAGIDAVIADENFVTMDFLLGNAAGWIKVQVREQDTDRAIDLLESARPVIDESEIPWDQPPEVEDEEDQELTPEERARQFEERTAPVQIDPAVAATENLVIRAYRTAIIGLVMLPPLLNVFSLIMLREARNSRNRFTDKIARHYRVASYVNLFAFLTFGWIWLLALGAIVWVAGTSLR